jgi:hypothetical protein
MGHPPCLRILETCLGLKGQLEYFYSTYVNVINGSNVFDLCNNVMVRRDVGTHISMGV